MNPIAHEEYQNSNRKQIERYNKIKKTYDLLMPIKVGIALVVGIIFNILISELSGGSPPSFIHTVLSPPSGNPEIAEWLPEFIRSFAIFLLCLFVGMGIAHFIVPFKNFQHFDFSCPHCEGIIDVGHQWRCGLCAHKIEVKQTKLVNRTLFDGCKSCNMISTALMCPHCSNDIVLDLEKYNKAPRKGFGYEGTATELLPYIGHSKD